MNKPLTNTLCACISIYMFSIPSAANANWSIKTLDALRENNNPSYGHFLDHAIAINDFGQVVGESNFTAFNTEPNNSGMADLGTLSGRLSSTSAINDFGEVVGRAHIANGKYHAFLFSHGGITDLSLLPVAVSAGYNFIDVTDINNNGQIIGNAITNYGFSEMFLLSYTPDTVFDPKPIYIPPVPEPSTYLTLLAGMIVLGFVSRRKMAS